MLNLSTALILPLTKVLLKSWLGDLAAELGTNVAKIGLSRLNDPTALRKARQEAEATAASVIQSLQSFYTNERVDDAALEQAAFELAETVERHVDAAFLVHQRMDTDEIRRRLIDVRAPEDIYEGTGPEQELYVSLVDALAPRLRAVAPMLPNYDLELDTAILKDLATVAKDSAEVLSSLERIEVKLEQIASHKADGRSRYEAAYLKAVRDQLDYVEILGLDVERTRRDVPLTVAYLSLTTSTGELGKLDCESLLDLLPALGNRLIVEGPAGSGKSTLLRWIAVQAAAYSRDGVDTRWARLHQIAEKIGVQISAEILADYENSAHQRLSTLQKSSNFTVIDWDRINKIQMSVASASADITSIANRTDIIDQLWKVLKVASWREHVPFLVRLRHLKSGLPKPEDLPLHLSEALGHPPESWTRDVLSRGGALLLIDGVDEVPEGDARNNILNSIDGYLQQYEKCPVIIASRPKTFDTARLQEQGFVRASVDDLTTAQQLLFIDKWHEALATKLANLAITDAKTEILKIGEQLKRSLERQTHIARLADSPLLCAGICALHERNPDTLPNNEWDICAKLTEMLVELRDRHHGRQQPVRLDQFGPTYQVPYEDKRTVLARLAEAMVSQQLSTLPRIEALHHVRRALRELRNPEGIDAKEFLGALEARSGILRSAGNRRNDEAPGGCDDFEDAVEFAHNTLKSWLAALHYLNEGKPRELPACALTSGYDQVIVSAAAAPEHRPYVSKLTQSLLDRAQEQDDSENRRTLLNLVARCAAVATSLPKDLRQQIDDSLPSLFPPRNFDEAQKLASLGAVAVRHLGPHNHVSTETASAIVRCLALIRTNEAQRTARSYLARDESIVVAEMADILNPLEIPTVYRAATTPKNWASVPERIRARIKDLGPMRNHTFPEVQWLCLSGTDLADISCLDDSFSNLKWLDLSGTKVVDISAIAQLKKLVSVSLAEVPVQNISTLAFLPNLKWLDLRGTQVSDIEPLLGLPGRVTIDLSRTGVSAKDIDALRQRSPRSAVWC